MAAEDYNPSDMSGEDDYTHGREPVTIKYSRLIGGTPSAYLLDFHGHALWLPRSQITLNTKTCEITMPNWLYANRHFDSIIVQS